MYPRFPETGTMPVATSNEEEVNKKSVHKTSQWIILYTFHVTGLN